MAAHFLFNFKYLNLLNLDDFECRSVLTIIMKKGEFILRVSWVRYLILQCGLFIKEHQRLIFM